MNEWVSDEVFIEPKLYYNSQRIIRSKILKSTMTNTFDRLSQSHGILVDRYIDSPILLIVSIPVLRSRVPPWLTFQSLSVRMTVYLTNIDYKFIGPLYTIQIK